MKKAKQILKASGVELRLTERDYRGLIAFTLVAGLVLLLWKGDYQAASVLGTLAGTAVGWYFSEKRMVAADRLGKEV